MNIKNKSIVDGTLRWVEIYKIKNKINQKSYIGQAVSHRYNINKYYPHGMEKRFKQHICEANPKTVTKYHCNALNNAIRKYGVENFDLELIRICNMEEANCIETEEIIKNNSLVPYGYNITTSCNSHAPSIEFKKKISLGNISYHENKHLLKFGDIMSDINIDEKNIDKYITPRTKSNKQIGWYVRINNRVIEFKSTMQTLEETKKRAFNFIKLLKEESIKWQRDQIDGKSLKHSLPLISGNFCEELG